MGDFLFGVMIGLLIGIMLVTTNDARIKEYDIVVEVCQKDLPRTQTCKIIAVPDSHGDVK